MERTQTSQFSGFISLMLPVQVAAALLTRMSRRPHFSMAVSTSFLQSSSLVMSA